MNKVMAIADQVLTVLRSDERRLVGRAQIYAWVYEAEVAVAHYVPSATATTLVFRCDAGYRQDIRQIEADRYFGLLAVRCNGDFEEPGAAVNLVSLQELDLYSPHWRSERGEAVMEYAFDEREPTVFYVNPGVEADWPLTLSAKAVPGEYGEVDDNSETTVSEVFAPALIAWTLHRIYSERLTGSYDPAESQRQLLLFSNILGVKLQNDYKFSPKNPQQPA